MSEPVIRPIGEDDVSGVIELYQLVYGDSFPFPEFYDAGWVKKGIFSDDIEWVVAEQDGALLGTAAVMLGVGDPDDLIGEVGRLVVHPDARGGGLGTDLLEAPVQRCCNHLEFAFAECRTAHPGAQKIAARLGYSFVGFEPLCYALLGVRESVVFVARLFGNARRLRRNNPRVIPDVYELADLALRNCGLEPDLLVEPTAEPYPTQPDGVAELHELDDQQVYRLLRLSRGSLGCREVFGGMRLEYGFLKLKAHAARYLVLKRGGTIVGGLGYVCDDIDSKVRIFELLAVDDRAKGQLLEQSLRQIEARHDPAFIQVDVNAHAPRIQRTLDLLGFAAVAYSPSMVFDAGERLDVVKMVKLRVPLKLDGVQLHEPAAEVAAVVQRSVAAKSRGFALDNVARRVGVFQGLSDLQLGCVAAACSEVPYQPGESVFAQHGADQALFVVLDGAVDILLGDPPRRLATITQGEIFGELALIDELPRSAGAICREPSRLLVIRHDDFAALIDRDPALGARVLRNIARTLSSRLRRANQQIESLLSEPDRLL